MTDIPDDLLSGTPDPLPNPSGYTTIKDFVPKNTKNLNIYQKVQETLEQLHADPAMQEMSSSPFIAAVFAYATGWLTSRSVNQTLEKLDKEMPELQPHNRERLQKPILEAGYEAFMRATKVAALGGAQEITASLKGEKTAVSQMLDMGLNTKDDLEKAGKEMSSLLVDMTKTLIGGKPSQPFKPEAVDDAIAKATEAFKKEQSEGGGEDKPKFRKRF